MLPRDAYLKVPPRQIHRLLTRDVLQDILSGIRKGSRETKPVSMPADGNKHLGKDQCIAVEPGKATAFPLASVVGALLYRQTRLDISYVMVVISRYTKPSELEHREAAMRIFCYLTKTTHYKI